MVPITVVLPVLLFLLLAPSDTYASLRFRSPKDTAATCKVVPGSQDWPSPAEWAQLNNDLNGHLIASSPPALVCDPSKPSSYDTAKCDFVGSQWFNEAFHTADPVSVHYPNFQHDACLPTAVYNATSNCDTTPFPTYTVNATNAQDVAVAVRFAAKNSVRLSVKGTGHDFLGRNTGPGMSIWTHNIRGIEVLSSFQPTGCTKCDRVPAVSVAAGHVNCEVYAKTKQMGVVPVIGEAPGVGIGGYLTGGGHSPISGKFGLAVDNVLEMVVVAPDGSILTINDYQYKDLFWAMKGGGGSTFGVLISATLKTYPVFPVSAIQVAFSSTEDEAKSNNNTNWYSALAFFHSQIPKFTDNDIYGYYGFSASSPPESTGIAGSYKGSVPMTFRMHAGWGLNMTQKRAHALLSPLKTKLKSMTGLSSSIKIQQHQTVYDVIPECRNGVDPRTAPGYNHVYGSRLLDNAAVTDQQRFINMARALNPSQIYGLMIAGPGVRNISKIKTTSTTPAWRRTYLHIMVFDTFPFGNDAVIKQNSAYVTNNLTTIIRDHAPDMGCYINEADVNEPNYQQAFWGNNYPRLLQIKRKYDPNGVFWCPVCIGAEGWKLNSQNAELCPI